MALPTLTLNPKLEFALFSGHPWIYRDHLSFEHDLETGEWVQVIAGKARAYGLYDDSSPIAIRLFGREEPSPGFITERVKVALELRAMLFDKDTTAHRLISGEGDFLPGITVDRYERFAVVQTYADCLETILPEVVRALSKGSFPLKGIVRRVDGVME